MIDNPMAKADPDDSPSQTIARLLLDGSTIRGYGRRQHGLNGKNADLEACGQCTVHGIEVVDPIHAAQMKILIHLNYHASVSAPTLDDINLEHLKSSADPWLKELFRCRGVDLDQVDELADTPEMHAQLENIEEYFGDQVEMIIEGVGGPSSVFDCDWDDDSSWVFSLDATLEVPLTVEEYEDIECLDYSGAGAQQFKNACDQADKLEAGVVRETTELVEYLEQQLRSNETLATLARRIVNEVESAKLGGTPAKDAIKDYLEELALCHEMINRLECYKPENEDGQVKDS